MGELYGRVMPSSKNQVNEKTEALKKQIQTVQSHVSSVEKKIGGLKKETKSAQSELKNEIVHQQQTLKDLENKVKDIEKCLGSMMENFKTIDKQERAILRASNEAVWAEVFHDAILESTWLKRKQFYPGRWAAGYPFLYVLYRTLNEMHPMNILELGLGQTTRMIGQYAEYEKDCRHFVVEHDQEWIEIFSRDFHLSENSEIIKLEIGKKSFYETEPTTVYMGFLDKFRGRKFDLISIDAPFGGNTLTYSRMDVLQLLPECLNKDFVILLDDYNREAERNMIEILKTILKNNAISFCTGVYRGNKDTFMVTSESLKFLCTM